MGQVVVVTVKLVTKSVLEVFTRICGKSGIFLGKVASGSML